MGPPAKECRQLLEAEKGTGKDCLEDPRRNVVQPTLGLQPHETDLKILTFRMVGECLCAALSL